MLEHDLSYFQSTTRERDRIDDYEVNQVINCLNLNNQELLQGQEFKLNKSQSLGASDSAHDVFFLQTKPNSKNIKPIIVACKRFRRSENAEKEVINIKKISRRGFKTFQFFSKGIYEVEDVGTVLTTRLIPQFITMNHLPWRDYFLGQKEFVDRTQKPLETIGNFISTMHSQGIAHEDLQLKNIGKDQTNQFIIFDVENSIVNDEDKIDDDDFIDYVGEDIRTFLKSLVDKGFLYDSTEAIFLNAVENYFLTPYLENLKINNDHLLTLIGHAIDTCLEDRSVKNHKI